VRVKDLRKNLNVKRQNLQKKRINLLKKFKNGKNAIKVKGKVVETTDLTILKIVTVNFTNRLTDGVNTDLIFVMIMQIGHVVINHMRKVDKEITVIMTQSEISITTLKMKIPKILNSQRIPIKMIKSNRRRHMKINVVEI
jgi:hypothetical protein